MAFPFGQWNSLHTGPRGSAGSAANVAPWHESDFYAALSFDVENWELGIGYTSYLSPNDSFGTVQGLGLSLHIDDSAMLGGFSLSPHALFAIEVDGQADRGAREGVYVELGVEPGIPLAAVSVTVPLTLGVSLTDYYVAPPGNDRVFDYLDLGLVGTVAIPMRPAVGSWEVSGGTLSTFNGADDLQVVGTFGFNIGY